MDDLHLPWSNEALRELLLQVIQSGETTKVDFKRELAMGDAVAHAELLKDIAALANTYDYPYRNHGFLIIGVTGGKLSYTSFAQDEDKLQASIDTLVKIYLGPFISTQVRIFNDKEGTWGVIVVAPTRTAPHVFVKDIHKRYSGDIYVRRGTITEKASPTDYSRFFRQHLEEHTYELREQVRDLQREFQQLRSEQKASPRKKRSTKGTSKDDGGGTKLPQPDVVEPKEALATDLLSQIDQKLGNDDPIGTGLLEEARKIQRFLDSSAVPWSMPTLDKDVVANLLRQLEENAHTFWLALAKLLEADKEGRYDDAVVAAIALIAQRQEPPSGTPYNEMVRSIRYYPLVVSLHIVFSLAAFRNRPDLLKRIAGLELSQRSEYDTPMPLPYALFFIHRAADIFNTQHPSYPNQRWIDPVAMRVKTIFERELALKDPFWDPVKQFFIGEFLLSLTPLDVVDRETGSASMGHISAGAYLHFDNAVPILSRFLATAEPFLKKAYRRAPDEILADFDRTAPEMARNSPGWSRGFSSGAVQAAFPKKA